MSSSSDGDSPPQSTRSCPVSRTSPRLRGFLHSSSLREIRNRWHLKNEAEFNRMADDLGQFGTAEKPVAPPRPRREAQIRAVRSDSEPGISDRFAVALHDNYYIIAYSLVIIAYIVGAVEYLYLRAQSIFCPERTVYYGSHATRDGRRYGKDGFHYGVSIGAFIAIAFFQLICFFGLTISENWTEIKENVEESAEKRQKRRDLVDHVKSLISATMYRVFLCYGICSVINCGIIFYMVGIQDSIGDTVSTVFKYIFDCVVILYFVAFPVMMLIYHPNFLCLRSGKDERSTIIPPPGRSQSSTLETTISGLEQYIHSPRRFPRTTVV